MAHRSMVRRSSATVVRSPLLMFFRRRYVRPQEPDRPTTSEPLTNRSDEQFPAGDSLLVPYNYL